MASPTINLLVENLVLVELWLVLLDLGAHVMNMVYWAFVALHFLTLNMFNALVSFKVIVVVEILDSSEAFVVTSVGPDLTVLARLLLLLPLLIQF